MVQPIAHSPDDPISHPDAVARKKFSTVRRGYDPDEVTRFLRQVAAGLADATSREADMRARLGKAVGRAERAEQPSDKDLTDRLGEEVAQVIQAARDASKERIARAAAEADQTRSDAELYATDIRRQAEVVLSERTSEAEAAAGEIIAEAQDEAATIRNAAQATLRQSQDQAVAQLQAARIEGEDLIAQSQSARDQILQDMDRRRRVMRSQVELLKAGRDRLLQSHEVLRRSLDEIGTELQLSVAEAKIKGDNAERRMMETPLGTPDQLEVELADASMIGMVTLPDVERVPELDPDDLPTELRAAVVRTLDIPEVVEAAPQVSLPADATIIADDAAAVDEAALDEDEAPDEFDAAAEVEEVLQDDDAAAEVEAPDEFGAAAEVEEVLQDDDAAALDELLEEAEAEELCVEEEAYLEALRDEHASAEAEIVHDDEHAVDETAVDAGDIPAEEDAEEAYTPREVARTIVVPETARRLVVVDPDPAAVNADLVEADTPAATEPVGAQPAPAAPSANHPAAGKVSAMDRLFANLRDSEDTPEPEASPASAADEVEELHEVHEVEELDEAERANEAEELVDGDRGDAALARVRDASIADLEATIERRAKRVLADEQNAMLEWLNSNEFSGVLTDALPELDSHVQSYLEAVRPQLEACFGAGGAFVGAQEIDPPRTFTDAEQIIADRIVRPIRERFAAVDAEIDVTEATSIVSGFYRGHKLGDFAAQTQWMALLTFSRGTLAALPEGAGVRWAFHEGDGGCPDGYDNSFGGRVLAGEAFPSGHEIAPLGANCRCLLVPAEG